FYFIYISIEFIKIILFLQLVQFSISFISLWNLSRLYYFYNWYNFLFHLYLYGIYQDYIIFTTGTIFYFIYISMEFIKIILFLQLVQFSIIFNVSSNSFDKLVVVVLTVVK